MKYKYNKSEIGVVLIGLIT